MFCKALSSLNTFSGVKRKGRALPWWGCEDNSDHQTFSVTHANTENKVEEITRKTQNNTFAASISAWYGASAGGLALFFQASLVKSPLNLRPFLGAHLYIKKMQLYFTLLFLHWTKWAVWPPGEALRFHDFGWILFYIKLRLRASISKWSRQTSDWQKVVSLWCCHKMT